MHKNRFSQYMELLRNSFTSTNKLTLFTISYLFALILLMQNSWVPGFFHDGYLYAAFGKTFAESNNFWAPPIALDNPFHVPHHPPLLFVIEGIFFKIFGASWTAIRFFFSLFVFGALYLIHKMLKEEKLEDLAKLAGLFFIFLPPLFKKARSPGMDVPLMFFILFALSFYIKAFYHPTKKRYWFLTGTLFGFSLLLKGPPAMLIPMTICLHLLLTKKLKYLLNVFPWFSLVFGIFLATLWPLALFYKGEFVTFKSYLSMQFFGTIVEGRGNQEFAFFTYPYYLLENAGPWFLLSLLGIFQVFKKKIENPTIILFLSLYLAVLVPFSFVKWKYSNYIVPFFPALAVLAALPLLNWFKEKQSTVLKTLKPLLFILPLILLIFPFTNKIKRDKELFRVINSAKALPEKPKHWILVDDAYPYHNFLNLISFKRLGNVISLPYSEFRENVQKLIQENPQSLIFIRESHLQYLKETWKDYKELFYFKEKDLKVLTPKKDIAI